MATTDEKAFAAVEEELKKNPDATQDVLWEKAKAASPSIGRLNRRQFNARYPLQIKRRLLREAGGAKKRGAGAKKRAAGAKKRAAGAKKRAGKRAGGRKVRGAAGAVAAGGGEAAPKRRGRPPGSGKKAAGAAAPARAPRGGGGGGGNREAARQALLAFANDVLSAANQPQNLLRVFTNLDRYVDRATGTKG